MRILRRIVAAFAVLFLLSAVGVLGAAETLHYDFSGGTFYDRVSGGELGTLRTSGGSSAIADTSPFLVADDVWGNVLNLTGSQYLDSGLVASALGIGGGDAKTVVSWVNISQFKTYGAIFDVGGHGSANEFCMRTAHSNSVTGPSKFMFQYYSGDRTFTSPDVVDQWVQVATAYDNGQSTVYMNGVKVASFNRVLNVTDDANSGKYTIGVYHPTTSAAANNALVGKVANSVVYDEALTQAQIYQSMLASPAATSAQAFHDQYANTGATFFSFDGNLDNTGYSSAKLAAYASINTDGVVSGEGTAKYVESKELGGRQVIDMDGSFALKTDLTSGDLGVNGNNSRTFTVLAKIDEYTTGGLFDIPSKTANNNFSLRQVGTTGNNWRLQLYGTGNDYDFALPQDRYMGQWGLFTVTHDGATTSVYLNGKLVSSAAKTPATANAAINIGTWQNNFLKGQLADFSINAYSTNAAEARALYDNITKQYGGFNYTFNGDTTPGGINEPGWLAGCGNNAMRVLDSQKYLTTYPNGVKNATGEGALNVKIGTNATESNNLNPITGHVWGPVFTVLDETQSISMSLQYGAANSASDINKQPLASGWAGVALWDVEAGGFIEDTFQSGGTGMGARSISLAGLEGKEVMLVVVDRNGGGNGCVRLDDVTAPIGSVMLNDADKMHTVKWEFNFDEPGNLQGWTGDTDSFSVGHRINSNMFGFITPALQTDANTINGLISYADGTNVYDPDMGTVVSPNFTIDGDVLEFMIGGGESASLSFDLMVDLLNNGNFTSVEQSRSVGQNGQFYYDYWDLMDYKGLDAYLQLTDLAGADSSWGWIGVDNIRMLEFGTPAGGGDSGSVPEPATWLLLLLGTAGLVWSRRRQK